jgi:hypothetical protein
MPLCHIRKDLQQNGLNCPFVNHEGFIEADNTHYEYKSLEAEDYDWLKDDEQYIKWHGEWREVYNIDFEFVN